MRTKWEIIVEIESMQNGIELLRQKMHAGKYEDLTVIMTRIRNMEKSRDLLKWVFGEL